MNWIPDRALMKAAFLKYLPLGIVVFCVGLVWNFPYEKALGKITQTLSQQTGIQILSDSLSLALPIGISGKNVRIVQPERDLDYKLDKVRITISPFSILTYPLAKYFSASFSILQDQSRWKGGYSSGKKNSSFRLENKGWKVDHIFSLDEVNPMLLGTVLKISTTAKIKVELEAKTALFQNGDFSSSSDSKGSVSINASNVDFEAPFVREVRFDQIQLQGKIDRGKLTMQSGTLTGNDLTGSILGTVTLAPHLENSQVDLTLDLKAQPKFMESLKSILPMLQSSMGEIISADGSIRGKLVGVMPNIQFHGN